LGFPDGGWGGGLRCAVLWGVIMELL